MANSKRYGSASMSETAPGSGKWRFRVYLGRDPRTGNPLQRHATFKGTAKQAGKELARLATEADDGKVTGTAATVGQLLDAWLEHIAPSRRPKTVHEYRAKIENYSRAALGRCGSRRSDRTPSMLVSALGT